MTAALTNHLWQSTMFAVLAALLTIALRKNRAQVRYWLWFSASCKFFVPFSLLISLGSHLLVPPAARQISTQIAPPAVSFTVARIAQPFHGIAATPPSTRATRDWFAALVLAVWSSGFAAIALIRLRSWFRLQSAVRASRAIGLRAPVEVRSSPGLLEPGVVGLFRPILLLPAGIVGRLTPPQLEAVLAHELCHVRRRDNLFASIHMIAEATFWFHPLLWWIGARLVDERERACDEEVLRLGSEPQVYAEGILNVCKYYVESPLVCVSGVTGSDLKKRMEGIMKHRSVHRLNFARKAALVLAGIATLTMPIAVGVMNAPSIRAQTAPPAAPTFEASSIRVCRDEPGRMWGAGHSALSGTLNTGCMPLVDAGNTGLIQRAYVRFADGQPHWPEIIPIEGGPAWIRSELYAINAKAEGNPSQERMEGPMMQALLKERFKLKIHRETRQVPVYALTVAEGGPRLTPFEEGSCTDMPLTIPRPALAPGQRYCKVRVGLQRPTVDAEGATLTEFSQLLDLVLDRPVIDRTGITGKFDIHLDFATGEATSRSFRSGDSARWAGAASHPAVGSILAAVQRLGLRLDATDGPREFLVVDHVEKPMEN